MGGGLGSALHYHSHSRQSAPWKQTNRRGKAAPVTSSSSQASKLLGLGWGPPGYGPALSSLQTTFSILAQSCLIPHSGRASCEFCKRGPSSDPVRLVKHGLFQRACSGGTNVPLPRHSPRKGGVTGSEWGRVGGWQGEQMSGGWGERGTLKKR